jgi:hypothetical protein
LSTTPSSPPTEEAYETEFNADDIIPNSTTPVPPDPVKAETDPRVLWISVSFMVVFIAVTVTIVVCAVRRGRATHNDGDDGQMIPLSDLNSSVTSTGKFSIKF